MEINELKLWQFIFNRLNQNQPILLLSVLESKGSSPGRQGFKMAVANDALYGSIGGGIMEHKFVEMAKKQLSQESNPQVLCKQFHSKDAAMNQSGMICSGMQTIHLYRLQKSDLEPIEQMIKTLEKNKNGQFKLSQKGLYFSDQVIPNSKFSFQFSSELDWEYEEKMGYKNKLFIIGGGHCSLAFSQVMSAMDFYICLYEERSGLNTVDQNHWVHEKKIVDQYADLQSLIESGSDSYVVIMTFGYKTDDQAFRFLAQKDFKYLGILGSQAKMQKLFAEWESDGISEEKLQKVHSPIGLSIHSQTPYEIAISIAAEIIKVKNSDPANFERPSRGLNKSQKVRESVVMPQSC